MSLAQRLSALSLRVGQEFKAFRLLSDSRYVPVRPLVTISTVVNTNASSLPAPVETPVPSQSLGYLGARISDLVNVQGSGAYGNKWKNGGASAFGTTAWGVCFRANRTRYVELKVAPTLNDASIRIFIDGVEEQLVPRTFPAFPLNVYSTIKIDLGPDPRKIAAVVRVDLSSSMLLGSVWVDSGGYVTPVVEAGKRVAFLGDSLTQSEVQNTGAELGSFVGYMSRYLNTADIWHNGVRGSGPNTTSSNGGNYKTRAASDIVNSQADTVVISGWFNDRSSGRTPAQVAADMATAVDTILTMANKPQVMVFGSPDPTGGTNATEWATYDSAVQAAMQVRGVPYVSLSTGQVWNGSGVVIHTQGPWIGPGFAAWFFGSDNLHPTDLGHQYLASRYAEAIAVINKDIDVRRIAAARYPAWDTELILNGSALAAGYNDVGGGVQVNNPHNPSGINLESISFRLGGDPDASPVIGGSGDLTIQYYLGSPTGNTTLVSTATIASGGHDVVTILAAPIQCAHNSVLRAKVTLGSTTVSVPCHVQFRGRYV